jgi:hypothetical protein
MILFIGAVPYLVYGEETIPYGAKFRVDPSEMKQFSAYLPSGNANNANINCSGAADRNDMVKLVSVTQNANSTDLQTDKKLQPLKIYKIECNIETPEYTANLLAYAVTIGKLCFCITACIRHYRTHFFRRTNQIRLRGDEETRHNYNDQFLDRSNAVFRFRCQLVHFNWRRETENCKSPTSICKKFFAVIGTFSTTSIHGPLPAVYQTG